VNAPGRNGQRNGQGHHNGRVAKAGDDAWRELIGYLLQLEQYVSLYIRVREDAIKVRARETLWRVGLGLVALIAVVTVIAVSVIYVFDGTSRGLVLLLGGRQWLASLVTGGGTLIVLGLAAWAGHSLVSRAAHRRRIAEYEENEDRYKRAAARAGIPGAADGRGALGHHPGRARGRTQRAKDR
jgi:hypothetical protein